MNKNFHCLKGMNDYLCDEIILWNFFLKKIKKILNEYCYNQIVFPILEDKKLFDKSINCEINKQMYIFKDKNKKYISLRPEGTSICVRLGLENGIFRGQKHKWWYFGPMFRYENPQLGRYREFYQLGIESFGYESFGIEIELIIISYNIFKKLNLLDNVYLEINYISNENTRKKYENDIFLFIKKNNKIFNKLNIENSNKNILKILNTKNNFLKEIIYNYFPKITSYLTKEEINYFDNIKNLLKKINIKYIYNPFLFRGIDYYNSFVFEWKTCNLKISDISICSGGRYDYLSKILGSKKIIPSIGLAFGWNRLMLLLKKIKKKFIFYKKYLFLTSTNISFIYSLITISENIRKNFKNIKIFVDYSISNLKNKNKFIKNNKINSSIIFCIFENKKKILYKNKKKKIFGIDDKDNIFNIIKLII